MSSKSKGRNKKVVSDFISLDDGQHDWDRSSSNQYVTDDEERRNMMILDEMRSEPDSPVNDHKLMQILNRKSYAAQIPNNYYMSDDSQTLTLNHMDSSAE